MLPPRAAPRPIGGGCGHGPRRSAQPPEQPRVIGIQSAALERAPGLVGSREGELGGPGRELKIKGGSRPGPRDCTADCNAADCRAEYSPQLPLLIISICKCCLGAPQIFASFLEHHSIRETSICRFNLERIVKGCADILVPSTCLGHSAKLASVLWKLSDMSEDEKCRGIRCHTSQSNLFLGENLG